MILLADVVALLDSRYPHDWAEPWDRVGLVTGRPAQPVNRVLGVVDVTAATVAEAREMRADLIVAHHPLLLSGVSSVAATTPEGRIIHDLIEGGIALYVAHTNADVAVPGVSDALADALGIVGRMPLKPTGDGRGLGRVGRLPVQMPLREFAQLAARVLLTGNLGVRVTGDPARRVTLVAVCGGSGAEFLPQARELGVDVYVTADLKHHGVIDHLAAGLGPHPAEGLYRGSSEGEFRGHGPALIDAGHWSTEQPWVAEVTAWLTKETGLETIVSQTRTDPWSFHVYGHNRSL